MEPIIMVVDTSLPAAELPYEELAVPEFHPRYNHEKDRPERARGYAVIENDTPTEVSVTN